MVPSGTTAQKTVPASLSWKVRPTLVSCTSFTVGSTMNSGGVSSLVVNGRGIISDLLAPLASTSQK